MDLVLEETSRFGKKHGEKGDHADTNAFSRLTGGQQVKNQLKGLIASGYAGKKKDKDKSDRSVVEKVIDAKTERLFEKWIRNGVVRVINGCVSSGKEANVYHAVAGDGKDLALKIYKVDTMVFRDREEYISGEHRFQRGHVRSNAYKLIKVWAEKEFRNLRRIKESGILCPEAYLVKENLILMEFLGKDGDAAPRLKDAPLNVEGETQRYHDIIVMMRKLWAECKLVHGDLSAYNMLWHEGKIALIDVSQSVEESHPQAIEFLKRDLLNVSRYFRKLGVKVADLDRAFDLIREKAEIHLKEDIMSKLKTLIAQTATCVDEDWEILADRFISKAILRGLHEIAPEEVDAEMERIQKGGQGKYTGFLGNHHSGQTKEEVEDEDQESSSSEASGEEVHHEEDGQATGEEEQSESEEEDGEEEDSDSEESSQGSDGPKLLKPISNPAEAEELERIIQNALLNGGVETLKGIETVAMKKRDKVESKPEDANRRRADDFSGMTKEERKKMVKEEKREQRANKIPKKEKKKLTKKAKH